MILVCLAKNAEMQRKYMIRPHFISMFRSHTCSRIVSIFGHIFFMFRKSQTWASVLEAARDNVIYVAAFTAQLENPATLPEHLKLAKDKQDATRLVQLHSWRTPPPYQSISS
jgi:hypothetical protein